MPCGKGDARVYVCVLCRCHIRWQFPTYPCFLCFFTWQSASLILWKDNNIMAFLFCDWYHTIHCWYSTEKWLLCLPDRFPWTATREKACFIWRAPRNPVKQKAFDQAVMGSHAKMDLLKYEMHCLSQIVIKCILLMQTVLKGKKFLIITRNGQKNWLLGKAGSFLECKFYQLSGKKRNCCRQSLTPSLCIINKHWKTKTEWGTFSWWQDKGWTCHKHYQELYSYRNRFIISVLFSG